MVHNLNSSGTTWMEAQHSERNFGWPEEMGKEADSVEIFNLNWSSTGKKYLGSIASQLTKTLLLQDLSL